MALDTFRKRLSAILLTCPWRVALPLPDGTVDQGDRQHLLYLGRTQSALPPPSNTRRLQTQLHGTGLPGRRYGSFGFKDPTLPLPPQSQSTQLPAITYPRFPQPILVHPVSGQYYYLQIGNMGGLHVGGKTLDPPTNPRRQVLVDAARTVAYEIRLTSVDPPAITVSAALPGSQGGWEDLFVWSPNGREWAVQVLPTGALQYIALSSDWEKLRAPLSTIAPDGRAWHLTVAEHGVYSADGPHAAPFTDLGHTVRLRSQDDTIAAEITVSNDGILSVSDPIEGHLAPYYEAELLSPHGAKFFLTMDSQRILYVTDWTAIEHNRDEWPLVVSQNGQYLYVVDDRFPPPIPGIPQGRRRQRIPKGR